MVLGSLGLVAGSLVPKFGPEGPTFGSLVPRVVEVDRVVEVIRMVRVGEVYLDGGESDCPF